MAERLMYNYDNDNDSNIKQCDLLPEIDYVHENHFNIHV